MKKILALSIIAASLPAFAGSYTAEVNVGYGSGEVDYGDTTVDLDTWMVGGNYYVSKVSTDKGPLAEAAFLSKATSFSAMVGRTSFDDDDDADLDHKVFGVHVVGPNDLILELQYTGAEEDDLDIKSEEISLSAGTYLDDRHAVLFSYAVNLDSVGDVEDNIETFGAQYHGFMPLAGDSSLSYDASLDYIDVDYDAGYDDDGFGIGAGITWYPMRTLGVGLSLQQTDVGDITTTEYAIDAEYFFTENIAASLAYSVAEEDDDNAADTVDTDLILVGVTARF